MTFRSRTCPADQSNRRTSAPSKHERHEGAGSSSPLNETVLSSPITQPDSLGHWGRYGGRFVPETLMAPLEELTAAYEAARADENFQDELDHLLRNYAGRPTPLFLAKPLTEQCGGVRIDLKLNDPLHTGAKKSNNTP